MSATTYRAVKKLRDKYGLTRAYEIQREGSGLSTRYTIMPDDKLSEDQRTAIQRVWESDQFDLEFECGGSSAASGPTRAVAAPGLSDSDIPF